MMSACCTTKSGASTTPPAAPSRPARAYSESAAAELRTGGIVPWQFFKTAPSARHRSHLRGLRIRPGLDPVPLTRTRQEGWIAVGVFET